MPHFLQSSFDMLRESQEKMMENMSAINPMAQIPGFEAMKAQQEAFLKAMTGGFSGGWTGGGAPEGGTAEEDDLDKIKQQLAELQAKLSKLS